MKSSRMSGQLSLVLGHILGLLFGALAVLIANHAEGLLEGWTYYAGYFVLIPMGMGIVASLFWARVRMGSAGKLGHACLMGLASLCLASLVLKEGTLCLVMVAPLLFFFMWVGVEVGQFFALRNSRLNVSLLPLILTALMVDARMPHHYENAVTDTVVIHARPEQVWRYIADYPKITKPDHYWLYEIGMPAPVQAVTSAHALGASRRCIFSGNVEFEERIVEWSSNRRMVFAITKQAQNPEILHHLTFKKGELELRDNGDGTTTLIGTSWYNLNVYPSWYFDVWTRDLVRHAHLRVMNRVKELAEQSGARTN